MVRFKVSGKVSMYCCILGSVVVRNKENLIYYVELWVVRLKIKYCF